MPLLGLREKILRKFHYLFCELPTIYRNSDLYICDT